MDHRPHAPLHPIFRSTETEPMEFLCRSWSLSACEISKAVRRDGDGGVEASIKEEMLEEEGVGGVRNPLSFASSETSLLVLERILSQSQELSPRTSGRLSHRSSPLNGGGGSVSDSPPVSPLNQRPASIPTGGQYKVVSVGGGAGTGNGGGKTVGRWLKDRREKKKEELRAHNAQIHAAVSVAGVASAIAAIAAATAASSGKDEQMAKTDLAVASAATLVAAQCVEAAEAMGAERDHLTAVVSSAVNVRSPGDIMTLTAAAATALRAAATLKARTLKDVLNIAAVTPVEKGGTGVSSTASSNGDSYSSELAPEENFLGRDLLAKGSELLKRTRNGDLHWKIVSVYINKQGEVMLKTKSKHIAGTVTKKKKNVVLELVKDIPAWAGRHLIDDDGGEERGYFGLRMESGRVVEFECRNRREYEVWTRGVERLLEIAAGKKKKGHGK